MSCSYGWDQQWGHKDTQWVQEVCDRGFKPRLVWLNSSDIIIYIISSEPRQKFDPPKFLVSPKLFFSLGELETIFITIIKYVIEFYKVLQTEIQDISHKSFCKLLCDETQYKTTFKITDN